MNFEWKSKTHIKPVLVLGTSDTLKSVLTLQLIIGKCAKIGHTCDTGGSSTRVADHQPGAPIGAQVAPLLIP